MTNEDQELELLAREAEQVREQRPGVRIQWPEDFKRRASQLMMGGRSTHDVASALKVSKSSVLEWRQRQEAGSGFSEIKVMDKRKPTADQGIVIMTRRGHSLTLSWFLLKSLFQEGVL